MSNKKIELLLKEHHQDAFLWARQCCSFNTEDAKEVLQIVYLKIFEGRAVYSRKSSFKTWLFSTIRFTAIDFLKKRPSYETLENIDLVEEEPEAVKSMDYKRLLTKLSDRQQQVLLLSFYHGMTLAEIAEVINVHIGTVRTHYERGKEALKHLIIKEEYE